MALGHRRTERQAELWLATAKLPGSISHVFYDALNGLLGEGGFDEFVETLCEAYYEDGGRPGILPGVYFRMIFVGYFEGIDSQRDRVYSKRAWRCRDSLSLPAFTLAHVLEEVTDWLTSGRSRFQQLLESLNLPPPDRSSLETLFPATTL